MSPSFLRVPGEDAFAILHFSYQPIFYIMLDRICDIRSEYFRPEANSIFPGITLATEMVDKHSYPFFPLGFALGSVEQIGAPGLGVAWIGLFDEIIDRGDGDVELEDLFGLVDYDVKIGELRPQDVRDGDYLNDFDFCGRPSPLRFSNVPNGQGLAVLEVKRLQPSVVSSFGKSPYIEGVPPPETTE